MWGKYFTEDIQGLVIAEQSGGPGVRIGGSIFLGNALMGLPSRTGHICPGTENQSREKQEIDPLREKIVQVYKFKVSEKNFYLGDQQRGYLLSSGD